MVYLYDLYIQEGRELLKSTTWHDVTSLRGLVAGALAKSQHQISSLTNMASEAIQTQQKHL
jgi:hypothetical protein